MTKIGRPRKGDRPTVYSGRKLPKESADET